MDRDTKVLMAGALAVAVVAGLAVLAKRKQRTKPNRTHLWAAVIQAVGVIVAALIGVRFFT